MQYKKVLADSRIESKRVIFGLTALYDYMAKLKFENIKKGGELVQK